MYPRRKAKIVCTIGPVTSSEKRLRGLIETGMDVARLNFSHGDYDSHSDIINKIRKISKKLKKNVSILQDLQGIKIRVGRFKNGSIHLVKGEKVKIMKGEEAGDEQNIYISYPWLIEDAKVGDRILLDDGLIQLDTEEKGEDFLIAKVVEGGILKERKGVNLPHMKISAPSFTEKDRNDLEFGIKMGVDYVAISFVRSASDVAVVKDYIAKKGSNVPVIAKIEKEEAIEDIDMILKEADGIMVARGDLGVEIPLEEVPVIQKMLIKKANENRRIVITATQMLESMTQHSRPTRAETTDVANAVIDGTDALMLSGETSAGKYPVETVRVMDMIISYTEEKNPNQYKPLPALVCKPFIDQLTIEEAVAHAASQAADDVGAKLIAAFTRSGFTARLISKFRPDAPIIAFSPDEGVVRQMSIYRGVQAYYVRSLTNTDDMIKEVNTFLLKLGYVNLNDRIILVASHPVKASVKTNIMKIHVVTD